MPSTRWRRMDQANYSPAMAGVSTRAGVSSSVDSVSSPADSGSEDAVQRTTPNVAKAADNERGCEGRLSLLAIIFPVHIVRLINSDLTTGCVWCDEHTGVLVRVDVQYDWICTDCFIITQDETGVVDRSVIDQVNYSPAWF